MAMKTTRRNLVRNAASIGLSLTLVGPLPNWARCHHGSKAFEKGSDDAYISGGGGGAGGGIWLDGALSLTGTLEAAGGDGGQVVGSSGFGTGGGGGGGGRIKLAGCTKTNTASISVSGGTAGSGSTKSGGPPDVPPADGSVGTYKDVADASCVVPVELDILPGSDENPITLGRPGSIPVAILSDSDFDASTDVDRASLTFGTTGDEESLTFRGSGEPACGTEDVNEDGLDDLVCQFDSELTGFQEGDTEGVLKGQTNEDVPLE